MADDGVKIPLSTGGLLRYYDEYKSNIVIKPQYVVLLIVLIVILGLALKLFVPIKG